MGIVVKGWGKTLRIPLSLPGRSQPPAVLPPTTIKREHPAGGAITSSNTGALGIGADWADPRFGEYFATSVSVYSAIKIRADAAARVPLRIFFETEVDGEMVRELVPPDHPARKLLNSVNPHWTRSDLWRATETYFNLWGSEYWALFRPTINGPPTEIWPLRPDRIRIITDEVEYIKGYVLIGNDGKPVPFLPEDIVRFRNFNPLNEFAGISPIAPVRQSVDLGFDALRGNRMAVANDSTPGMMIETQDTMTDAEVKEFYERWEERFQGPNRRMRPGVLSGGMKPSSMGFTPKDMEQLQSMLWSLQDVSRVYGVPPPLLADLSRATYANVEAARKMFWESTMVPQLDYHAEVVQEFLIDPHWNTNPNASTRVVVAFDFTVIEALSENADSQALRLVRFVREGILTRNEARTEIGRKESDQPGADDLTITIDEPVNEEAGEGVGDEDLSAVISQRVLKRLPSPRLQRASTVPHPDDALRASVLFRTALEQAENKYFRSLQQLFNDQTKQIIRNLQTFRSAHSIWGEKALVELLAEELTRQDEDILPTTSQIFHITDYVEEWAGTARPLTEEALIQAGRSQSLQFSLGVDFKGQRPITQAWLDSRTKWWAQTVNETTGTLVNRQVKLANEAGEGIQELTERISKLGIDNAEVRAPTIARTEMVVAQNQGHLDMYEEAEVEGKQWLSHNDTRVRTAHFAAHEQVRRLKTNFRLGNGVSLIAPGQSGIAAEDINCRDVTVPVLEIREDDN